MTLQVVHTIICDGCGAEVAPGTVLPVTLLDENRQEVHFCDHRCLVPYAERRHAERLTKVRAHLAGNVEQITTNLVEAQTRATAGEVAATAEADAIKPFLEPARQALADHDARYPEG